jgi:hypothetical protein
LIKAVAITLGPILCGALLFFAEAGGQKPGVYLDTPRGMFELSRYSTAAAPPFPGVLQRVAVPPDARVISFFVVGPPGFPIAAHVADAALYLFVVDRRDEGFQSEYLPIRTHVTRASSQLVHITSEDLGEESPLPGRFFQDVLSRTIRSRASVELYVGLAVSDAVAGSRRLYAVRFGPQ